MGHCLEAAAATVASPETDNLRSMVTPSGCAHVVLPLLQEPIGLTPVRTGALAAAFSRSCGSSAGPYRTSSIRTRHATRTAPTPDGAPLWNMSKGRAIVPPLSRAVDQTDMGGHDLSIGSGSRGRCSSRSVEPSPH